MASILDHIAFVKSVKWYKRIFFPIFLNKREKKEYKEVMSSPKTELDYIKDMAYYSRIECMRNYNYFTKSKMEYWNKILDEKIREENQKKNETDNPGGDN